MKLRTFGQPSAAEACTQWLTAATGGRKPDQVAEVVSRIAAFERLASPMVLGGGRGDPFRNALSFQIIGEGRRGAFGTRRRTESSMRPDTSLLLVQRPDGRVHADMLRDPDLTPSRAADDIRLRLSKRTAPDPRWSSVPDNWRSASLHAGSLAQRARQNSVGSPFPGLVPLLADLLRGEPVRAPFDGTLWANRSGNAVLSFRLKARRGDRSVSAWPDEAEYPDATRSVKAGQVIGTLADDPALADRLAASYGHLVTHAVLKACDLRNEQAASAFLGLLDGRVFDVMRAHGEASVPLYNWISAASDDKLMAIRRQAFESYPLLVSALCSFRPEALRCVDEEDNFVERVSAEVGTTRRAVRSLGGIRLDDFREGDTSVPNPDRCVIDMLPALRHLPDGHIPSSGSGVPSGQQWRSLCMTVIGVRRAMTHSQESVMRACGAPPPMAKAMDELKGEAPFWVRKGGALMAKTVHDGSWHVGDLKTDFAVALLFPLIHDLDHDGSLVDLRWHGLVELAEKPGPDGSSALRRSLLRDLSAVEIARIAGEYMDRADRIADRLNENRTWPAWSDARSYATRYGTVTVTPRTDARSLVLEGKVQKLCVGTYVRGASTGNFHIYSVTEEDGTRLSTIELRVDGNGGGYVIVQHEGADHAPPPPAAQVAADLWMEDIRSGRLAVTPFRLEETPGKRWTDEIGYDPTDPGLRDLALRSWGFALPPEERGMSHAEWAERHGLRDLLAELVPDARPRPAA